MEGLVSKAYLCSDFTFSSKNCSSISKSLETQSNACNCSISATDHSPSDVGDGGRETSKSKTFFLSEHWTRSTIHRVLVQGRVDGRVVGIQELRSRLHHHPGYGQNNNQTCNSFMVHHDQAAN